MERVIQYVQSLIPRGMDFGIEIIQALLVIIIGLKVVHKLVAMLKKAMLKRDMEPGVVTFFSSALKLVLNVLLILAAAQILGFATSSIIAVIGSAGLAIGLALQGSLANFAGGVLILLMKPFVVGDYIIVGSVEGTVKKIDIVYTTLLTADNRSVILPNGKLADSDIINNTREGKRRLDIEVGIEYSENIQRAREVLMETANRQEYRLEEETVNVVVASLDESAVTLMVQMWVLPEVYVVAKASLLEEIKNEFERNNITIPYRQLDVMVYNQ